MHVKQRAGRGELLYITQNLAPQMLTDMPVQKPSAKSPNKLVCPTGAKERRGP